MSLASHSRDDRRQHGCHGAQAAEEALLEVNRTLEAQAALLQSREELLKIFVKNVPAGVAMLDRDMRYLQVSDRWCADYSVDSSQVLGRSHYELFPDVPQRWKEMHRRALEGETLRADEDRWDREGGTTAWVRWEIRPWRTPSGIVGGILIFAEDITRRKQMEEAISGMSRKLIESQEQERARIGRELHDDINQTTRDAVASNSNNCKRIHLKSRAVCKNSEIRRPKFRTMCKRCRTICTLQNWNIWVSSRGSKAGARNSASGREWRSTSAMMYTVLYHSKSVVAFFEFYRKPCTTRRSTAG